MNALVNALGNLGGFLGPYAMGWFIDVTGGTRGAFLGAAVLGLVAAALCVVPRRAASSRGVRHTSTRPSTTRATDSTRAAGVSGRPAMSPHVVGTLIS